MSDLGGNLFLLEPARVIEKPSGNVLLIFAEANTESGCFTSGRFCKCLDSHLSYIKG